MKYLRWLYTDDETGIRSGTTFRMWLLFIPLYYVVILAVIRLTFSSADDAEWFALAMQLLNYLGGAAGAGAVAYGIHRRMKRSGKPPWEGKK